MFKFVSGGNLLKASFHLHDSYIATRIFWSFKRSLTRTLYILRVDRSSKGNPIFSIRDTKEPNAVIRGKSLDEAYNILMELVMKANSSVFSSPSNPISVKPVKRQKNDTFGLNAPQVSFIIFQL